MRFEERELKPYAEPVVSDDLRVGSIYFYVQFVDDEMLIPVVEPLVFVGTDLTADDQGTFYFQDVESYRQGVRFESRNMSSHEGLPILDSLPCLSR